VYIYPHEKKNSCAYILLAPTSIKYIIAITFANLHTKYHAYIIAWYGNMMIYIIYERRTAPSLTDLGKPEIYMMGAS